MSVILDGAQAVAGNQQRKIGELKERVAELEEELATRENNTPAEPEDQGPPDTP